MSNVTFEIPAEFASCFGATEAEVARNAKIELAIEMYRESRWSTGRAAEFAGLGFMEFVDLLRERKVEKPYTIEMVEEDFAYARSRE